jgi:hypothetical protein
VASPAFGVFTAVRPSPPTGLRGHARRRQGAYLEAKFPERADFKAISNDGADVPDLAPLLAQGKVTVVDFSALWCMPCRQVDEHMAKLLATRARRLPQARDRRLGHAARATYAIAASCPA